MSNITGIIVVRQGLLPVGGPGVAAMADEHCWLIGDGSTDSIDDLRGLVARVSAIEADGYHPASWSQHLAPLLASDDHLLLPHSPDGRDLAPRLAAILNRPLVTSAIELSADRAVVARHGGRSLHTLALGRPVVATLQIAGSEPAPNPDAPEVEVEIATLAAHASDRPDADLIEVLEADPATMDLAEAPRIVAGGAGLGQEESFRVLYRVAERLGASTGATRVVTDWGWAPVERQIGTTGVLVDPDLYLAVGISGAIQHTAGLGSPDHVVVVNTDPSCPMMDMADIGIICDGPAFLEALADRLDSVHSAEDL